MAEKWLKNISDVHVDLTPELPIMVVNCDKNCWIQSGLECFNGVQVSYIIYFKDSSCKERPIASHMKFIIGKQTDRRMTGQVDRPASQPAS